MNEQEKQIKEKYEEVFKKQDEFFKALSELNDLKKETGIETEDETRLGFHFKGKYTSEKKDTINSSWVCIGNDQEVAKCFALAILSSGKLREFFQEIGLVLSSAILAQNKQEKEKKNGKKTIAS